VIPWTTIDRTKAPDGTELVLARRGDEWVVRAGGHVLMGSRMHGSEEALATLALDRAAHRRRVLVGGLGLGFTLRAVLDRVPADARVTVGELTSALVDWNRGPVAHLAGRPLDDPRVTVRLGDVAGAIAEGGGRLDAILLDVDNSPSALVHPANAKLYTPEGLHAAHAALAPGGVLAVWSVGSDAAFEARLAAAGFVPETRAVAPRGLRAAGTSHAVLIGTKGAPERPSRRRSADR
jgi:spermidine synthase